MTTRGTKRHKWSKKASWTIPRIPIDSTPSACLEPFTLHLPCPLSTAGYATSFLDFLLQWPSHCRMNLRELTETQIGSRDISAYRHPTLSAMPQLLRMTVKPLSDPHPCQATPASSLDHSSFTPNLAQFLSRIGLSHSSWTILCHRVLISLLSWITPMDAFRMSVVLISCKKPS